ncbi:Holliday junction branch migration protein RuvA [Gemmobacter nectariphilus]|uniref:Holliday junction branch migration protein RuvA n=1 Tax=Gemmobacter nectariphilus TaxID=220343 RepID=UPI0003FFABA9|nr:Holliday junction branch migration protein RuvA [Gemmobacter nectariphilus]
MIGKLSGIVDWKGDGLVILDVRGVGYEVMVSDRTLAALPPPGQAAALYTEIVVREDLLQLIGFPSLLDREWHRLLTTVQGVGAKAALAILGTLGPDGVARAIALGDARAIQAAPGVGPKIAQRVAMELKSKAPMLMAQGGRMAAPASGDDVVIEPAETPKAVTRKPKAPPPPDPAAMASSDALSALLNLGYAQGDAAAAVAQAACEGAASDPATLIRAALKLLQPKG